MKNKTIIFSIIIIISLISLSTLSATNIDSTDTPIHEKQTDTQQVNIKLPTNKIIEETTNVNKKDIVKKNKTTKKQINKTHSINKTKKDNNKTIINATTNDGTVIPPKIETKTKKRTTSTNNNKTYFIS